MFGFIKERINKLRFEDSYVIEPENKESVTSFNPAHSIMVTLPVKDIRLILKSLYVLRDISHKDEEIYNCASELPKNFTPWYVYNELINNITKLYSEERERNFQKDETYVPLPYQFIFTDEELRILREGVKTVKNIILNLSSVFETENNVINKDLANEYDSLLIRMEEL